MLRFPLALAGSLLMLSAAQAQLAIQNIQPCYGPLGPERPDLAYHHLDHVSFRFTVSGARPGTALHAVTRILRPHGPGWNPRDPVVVGSSGQAEFDLSGIPADRYEMSLIAWAPDGTAKPVSVRLPALTIRSED